jgi:hypothetical protein
MSRVPTSPVSVAPQGLRGPFYAHLQDIGKTDSQRVAMQRYCIASAPILPIEFSDSVLRDPPNRLTDSLPGLRMFWLS